MQEASHAGVPIRLIVRGICCLLPGIPGKTENIQIKSIVGRFLEHSRIFCFGTEDSQQKIYISSADWMTRNTENRVEIACPIEDTALRNKLLNSLKLMLADNVKGRQLLPDGCYQRLPETSHALNSQEYFIHLFAENHPAAKPEQA